jgi:uncharacterized protein YndB with AHSA1/START domain
MGEQFEMAERTMVIEREFDAPRELVWQVWTDPDEVTKWWGPEHFTTPREKIEFDLRSGGVCRMTMVGPDGVEYANDGRFGIVEPPETTVEFIDLGEDRTKLVITSRMICAEQLIPMAQAGWSSQLDKLERLLR